MHWILWQCVATVGLRVIIVWLYNNTAESLFAAISFHSMINVSTFLFPNYGSHYDPFLTSVIVTSIVVVIVYIWGAKTLAGKSHRDTRYPTPYADVNAIIDAVHTGAKQHLGDEFVGMYLYGSLASGGFNPETSDIDFVVATRDYLPEDKIAALEAMHLAMTEDRFAWAMKIEGSYIPLAQLRCYDPEHKPFPSLGVDMHFHMTHHLSDWILQRHLLREQGITLAGPPIHTLIDPVNDEDIRRAAVGILWEWWKPLLDDPAHIESPEYQAYAVLTMCRSFYTIQYAEIIPKPEAAQWAQSTLDAQWGPLIKQAVAWRHGMAFDELDKVLDFIRYTLAQHPRP